LKDERELNIFRRKRKLAKY